MPIITFSSPKGGAGKTTAATLLATELADRGATVVIIDADPNKNIVDWASLPGKPDTLNVVGDVLEETIVDAIEAAATKAAFVVIDLESTTSLMVSYAISMSDFVVIPVQGSQLDAKQAARQMRLIKARARIVQHKIAFAVLFTRSNPALRPKTQRYIEKRFAELGAPVLVTQLYEREAFRAIFSLGGSLATLVDKGIGNLAAAKANARDFTAEIVARLRSAGKSNQDRQVA